MEFFKLAALVIFGTFFLVILRQVKSEYAFALTLVMSCLIFAAVFPVLKSILDFLIVITNKSGVELPILPLLKSIGIAMIVSLAADICKDAGESAMGEKIVFAGKIAIVVLALPLARELIALM